MKTVTAKEQANQQEQTAPVLYDRSQPQIIPLDVTLGRKTFRVSHTLGMLSDERYFKFALEQEEMVRRAKKLTTGIYEPKHKLWKELAESVSGYGESADWKDQMYQADAVSAVNALLRCDPVRESEEVAEGEVLEFNRKIPVTLKVMQSGILIEVTHYYREETKSQMDAYLAIISNAPDPNALASSVKKSTEQKFAELARQMVVESEGYENNDIPAWHLAESAPIFFQGQIARVGKS